MFIILFINLNFKIYVYLLNRFRNSNSFNGNKYNNKHHLHLTIVNKNIPYMIFNFNHSSLTRGEVSFDVSLYSFTSTICMSHKFQRLIHLHN